MKQQDTQRRPTLLAAQIAKRIRSEGPLPVAEYMRVCLHDPAHGYYRTQQAIGSSGDFITAPEIAQVFGELIGLWCAVVWQQMGAPSTLNLIELGPGRGTLMRDALRAVRAVPGFRDAITVHLVESNATLVEQQRATLDQETVPIHWRDDMEESRNNVPTIVVANEFLDTIPIGQWVFRGECWRKRCVGLNDAGQLAFADGDADAELHLTSGLDATPREGNIFETRSPALAALFSTLADLGPPSTALLIDYGHAAPGFGDTLQGIRAHRYEDPLCAPGEADLTAQIDFVALANAMRGGGFSVDGPVTQAEFLGSLGIVERASHLIHANPQLATSIEGAVARLMAPNGMGTRFKAIGVRSPGLPPLPGLAQVDNGPAHP
ncbi:MAG: class I SAM-dependent methyltransferase [Hyphomicrobium sp.]